jgi:hypothetical protein
LKGVAKDYDRDAAAGCKLSGQSSHRAGTKRRRVIKSGADELLELEGAEEDEDDKDDSVDSSHHRRHDFSIRAKSWHRRWWISPPIARQWASATKLIHAFQSFLIVLVRVFCCPSSTPINGACMLRGYG